MKSPCYRLPMPRIQNSVLIAHKLGRSVENGFRLMLKERVHVVCGVNGLGVGLAAVEPCCPSAEHQPVTIVVC